MKSELPKPTLTGEEKNGRSKKGLQRDASHRFRGAD